MTVDPRIFTLAEFLVWEERQSANSSIAMGRSSRWAAQPTTTAKSSRISSRSSGHSKREHRSVASRVTVERWSTIRLCRCRVPD